MAMRTKPVYAYQPFHGLIVIGKAMTKGNAMKLAVDHERFIGKVEKIKEKEDGYYVTCEEGGVVSGSGTISREK